MQYTKYTSYKYCLVLDTLSKDNDNDKQDGLKSILVYVRCKLSNKSVSWKQEPDLAKISYFDHDETERGMLLKYIILLYIS